MQQYIDSELHPTQRRRHRLWGPRFAGALRKLSTLPATTTPDVIATQVTLTPRIAPRAKPPAPWTSIPVTVVLNDHLPSKHTTEAELLKTLTLATLDQLTIDKPVFYTDGSVMESKAAAAAVHKGTSIQLRLNDGASILQAELVATREAIYMATRANYNTACILSDSKAAIQAMYEMSCTLAQEQEFINLFSTLHYHKLINLPTRITQQSSSLLDNIYTTLPYHNSSKGVLISDHSDHYIVFTIQHGTTSTKAPTHREMRDFSEQNISKFKKKIKNTIWDKFYAIPLAQDAYSVFANHINNHFKECFPNKSVKINYRNKIT